MTCRLYLRLVADPYHCPVRRIDEKTRIVTTFPGNGSKEPKGDGGPAPGAGFDGIACFCSNHDLTKLYLSGFCG